MNPTLNPTVSPTVSPTAHPTVLILRGRPETLPVSRHFQGRFRGQ